MKFSFKIQQYQTDAVDAVARVFQGQPYNAGVSYLRDMGNLSAQPQQLSLVSSGDDATQVELLDLINDSGFKNEALQLTDQELLQNIRTLQAEANIHQSDKLVAPLGRCSLDIEMETGTGKTYVYIKTMFELNKRYGWSKFIVVVPSIAIREGVKKSFEITADHFMECYGKKARFFIYNSSNLNQLDSFSSNSGINVMIINTQAFAASMNEDKNVEGRKGDAAARIIYTKRDEFGSRRPIDVIAANRPILILDEPQKMGKEDSATQKALKKFNPLFTLNYSATHAKQHNLFWMRWTLTISDWSRKSKSKALRSKICVVRTSICIWKASSSPRRIRHGQKWRWRSATRTARSESSICWMWAIISIINPGKWSSTRAS